MPASRVGGQRSFQGVTRSSYKEKSIFVNFLRPGLKIVASENVSLHCIFLPPVDCSAASAQGFTSKKILGQPLSYLPCQLVVPLGSPKKSLAQPLQTGQPRACPCLQIPPSCLQIFIHNTTPFFNSSSAPRFPLCKLHAAKVNSYNNNLDLSDPRAEETMQRRE